MPREKQRQIAERTSAQEYFFHSMDAGRWSWVPGYLLTMKIDEVLCPECDYVPRQDSCQPRRAYRAHVKKYHALLYCEKYMKPYIIQEEPDFESLYADVALAYA